MNKTTDLTMSKDFQTKKFLSKRKISDLSSEMAQKIFTLLSITQSDADKAEVRILDEVPEDDLILVHYLFPHSPVLHIF